MIILNIIFYRIILISIKSIGYERSPTGSRFIKRIWRKAWRNKYEVSDYRCKWFSGKPLGAELLRQNYEVRAAYASLYRASLKIQIPSFRRRPESSGFAKNAFVSVRCAVYFIDWTPAFAGVLGSSQASQAGTVRKMADAIFHRGPDDGGVWCDSEQRIGFGHLNGNEAPSS